MSGPHQPLLVVVEGLDGVGKSTVVTRLARHLHAVELRTPARELATMREGILNALANSPLATTMFYATSVLAASQQAGQMLAQGRTVIMDRYYLSTLVYGEVLRGSEFPGPELDALERWLVPADLTVYLHASPECRTKRMLARGILSPEDRLTFQPQTARLLDEGYRCRANHLVAGQFVPIDTETLSADDIVLLIEHWIDKRRTLNASKLTAQSQMQGGAP